MILFAAFMILSLCSCGSSPKAAEPTPKPLLSVEEYQKALSELLPDAKSITVQRADDYDGIAAIFETSTDYADFSRHVLDTMNACIMVHSSYDYVGIVTVFDPETNEGMTSTFAADDEGEFCDVSDNRGDARVHNHFETMEDFLAAYPTVSIK